MDVSGSIGEENHKKQRDFVKSVTKNFKISPQETIVGVVTYSDDAQVLGFSQPVTDDLYVTSSKQYKRRIF